MSFLSQPTVAAPVIVEGRKFAAVTNGGALGLPQKTGYVSVIDVDQVDLLFLLKVYDVPAAERTDARPETITTMVHEAEAGRLVLTTDQDRRFAIDLGGLSISPLGD